MDEDLRSKCMSLHMMISSVGEAGEGRLGLRGAVCRRVEVSGTPFRVNRGLFLSAHDCSHIRT